MNPSDMLDYTLDQLEGQALARARREVAESPELAARIERLRASTLVVLGDRHADDDAYPPPPGLAMRTLSHVVQHAKRRAAEAEILPGPRRFRLGDLAMAATIFLASILALAPAVLRSRESWDRAACANNLREIGLKFHQYATIKNEFPFVPADSEAPHVGAMVSRMTDAGLTFDSSVLRCPSSGSAGSTSAPIPDMKSLTRMVKENPAKVPQAFEESTIALNVGFYHPGGKPGPVTPRPSATIPIAADSPDADDFDHILDGNSPNHGGRGQNVLFADGHAAWLTSRTLGPHDSDLYLNNENRPAYGLDSNDAVLMPLSFRVLFR